MSIICKNCGALLPDNSEFCGECGMRLEKDRLQGYNTANGKMCPFCGAQLPSDAGYCDTCGRKISNSYSGDEKINLPKRKVVSDKAGYYSSAGKGLSGAAVAAIATAAAIAAGAIIFIVIMIINNSDSNELGDVNDQPQVTYTAKATAVPVSTQEPAATVYAVANVTAAPNVAANNNVVPPAPNSQPAPTSPPVVNTEPQAANPSTHVYTYSTYTDNDYSFKCDYPINFTPTIVDSNFYRYTLTSPDGQGSLYICATSNNNGRTPSKVIDNFISSYGGTVDYTNSGSDWCVIRTKANGKYHYGYFKMTNGYIRGFEMHFPASQFDSYDKYVNDIYNSLSFY